MNRVATSTGWHASLNCANMMIGATTALGVHTVLCRRAENLPKLSEEKGPSGSAGPIPSAK